MDALKLLIIVFIIGGWIVNQLMQSKGGKPQTPPGQKPRPPVPPRADDVLTENSSSEDVASFLERARMKAANQQRGGQQRGGQQQGGQPAGGSRRAGVEVVVPPPFPTQKSRRKQQKAKQSQQTADANRGRGSQGQQHLSSSSIEQSISHLGERVGQADESMTSHLNEVFSHQVGRLGSGGAQVATSESSPANEPQRQAAPSTASEIAAMLANPQSARNAVILSEIFNRPTDRW